ncbi:hypothetical protein KR49_14015 [Synechococcus sp. KORDI-49]|nr:hypothetical protein KR49_14015 [Synechococcus sp. KORDI-49]
MLLHLQMSRPLISLFSTLMAVRLFLLMIKIQAIHRMMIFLSRSQVCLLVITMALMSKY